MGVSAACQSYDGRALRRVHGAQRKCRGVCRIQNARVGINGEAKHRVERRRRAINSALNAERARQGRHCRAGDIDLANDVVLRAVKHVQGARAIRGDGEQLAKLRVRARGINGRAAHAQRVSAAAPSQRRRRVGEGDGICAGGAHGHGAHGAVLSDEQRARGAH